MPPKANTANMRAENKKADKGIGKKGKNREKLSIGEDLMLLCTMGTIISVVWVILNSTINSFGWVLQGILTIISGVGAIGLSIPVVVKIRRELLKIHFEEEEKQ